MAKKIVWSKSARNSLFEILNYWVENNNSTNYSKKLLKLFNSTSSIIEKFPESGKKSEFENIRLKLVRNYLIVYQIMETEIVILIIWNTKQNPETLKEFFKRKNLP